ncbi:glutathione S-transferase [Caulobacter sp. AP07]|uniref:glutathione S-transferase family protein n=1 Tax=Caulobacter sp. AP07 TaxID=1144304 RepID=UPI000271E422|nr:glutathione S-transferase family protein [Caulobacter sp. AP07]EJL26239.1 glutathione S-transferase [Caulobacter sp. AP07]
MLKIWGRRSSFNVQKVLWLVGELDLPHQHIPAGGDFGGLDDPGFRALNPHGLVPVLQDGETTAWESHAILRYLAATYGAERFWPADPAARAPIDGWMDWSQTSLQPAFLSGVFWGWYRTPEALRDLPAIARALERTHRCLAKVEARLAEGAFVTGQGLSLADIPIGTCLYRYFELEIARPPMPRLEAWYARLRQRPAYREHVMVPFGELKGRLDF